MVKIQPAQKERIQYNTTISKVAVIKLKEIKEKTGVPMSQILERAFWKVYGED